tara:strand:+ start:112 stop:285 length:174 start_codon:yes stop_codon:yes gene_type:complete
MDAYPVSQLVGVRNDLLRALREVEKVVDHKTTAEEAGPKVRRHLDAAIRKSYRMERE